MSNNKLTRRLEGLGWLSIIAVIAWFTLSGPVERILSAEDRTQRAEHLSFQHASRLARPETLSDALRLRSHISPRGDEDRLGSGEIQTALISLVKTNRARLSDLRVLEDDTSIETLSALRFRLDIEGDLIAVLDVIKGFGEIGQPVLIDELVLKPVGNQDRPDRRLRASFELSFWRESSVT